MPTDRTVHAAFEQRNEAGRVRLSHPYSARRAVLSTRHDKLPLVAPPLALRVGLIVDTAAVDTDQFGTFTGDIVRAGSPRDTAVAKARLGMHVAGCTIGIASEGSIGPHPSAPFINAAVELVVLVDDELGIVIGETEIGFDILTVSADVAVDDEIDDLLERGRFPAHAMTIRPADGSVHPIYKGIRTRHGLGQAIRECATASSNAQARVETDLRAHQCPTRRPIIARAAERLAMRLASCCPECNTPGWGTVRLEFGLPCGHCGREVSIARADVFGCATCRATRTVHRGQAVADPSRCDWCNP